MGRAIIDSMAFCFSCGHQTRDQARFCGFCGVSQAVVAAGIDASPSPAFLPDLLPGPREGTLMGNRYILGKELGRGGFGIVFEGEDLKLQRIVAVKAIHLRHLIQPDKVERVQKRFEREALAAARLNHPNIVSVLDSGTNDDLSFIVMERVEGVNLEQMFRGGDRPSIERSIVILRQLLDALEHAHRSGVIHRDIKPANIIVMAQDRVKLADFGMAKIDRDSLQTFASTGAGPAGAFAGSPAFMSPEAVRSSPTDERSDIYGIAIVSYILFTGRRPFEKPIPALLNQIVKEPPPDPTQVTPGIPDSLRSWLLRGLAKNPSARFPSVKVMAEEFRIVEPDIFAWSRRRHAAGVPYDPLEPTALGALPMKRPREAAAPQATPSPYGPLTWGVAGILFVILLLASFAAGLLVGYVLWNGP